MINKMLAMLLFLAVANCQIIVGGFSEVDLNDQESLNLLEEQVKFALNAFENGTYSSQEYTITNAKQQVVAGMKYVTTVKFNDGETCIFTTWSRPWLNKIELLESSCD